jgi:hypothetical protein
VELNAVAPPVLVITLDDGTTKRSLTVRGTMDDHGLFESAERWADYLEDGFGSAAGFWTVDAVSGQSNTSPLFTDLVDVVEHLILGGCGSMILNRGWVRSTAGMIVVQLAYKHGMVPLPIALAEDDCV